MELILHPATDADVLCQQRLDPSHLAVTPPAQAWRRELAADRLRDHVRVRAGRHRLAFARRAETYHAADVWPLDLHAAEPSATPDRRTPRLAMQKVVGSSPIIRSESPCNSRLVGKRSGGEGTSGAAANRSVWSGPRRRRFLMEI